LHNIERLILEENPDIVCLQETKVQDQDFPISELNKLGFKYIEISGQKSYNGVAILSKIPFSNVIKHKFAGDASRHVSVVLSNQIELHNFYVPSGGDIADPELNAKFANKLEYLAEVTSWFKHNRSKEDKMILLGDLNIAPLDNDVWSHKQLLKEVSHTPIEIEKLSKWQKTINWCDIHRESVPHDQKLYSWWSYRNKDWRKSNRGRRLDHIWVTPPLIDTTTKTWILKDARDWHLPSDHVPVMAKFNL
jgi:exodeoxyribonuclease-3